MEDIERFINNKKARPQQRQLHPLFFARSGWFSDVPLLNQYGEDSGDGACGLLFLSEKTRTANHLQMSW